MAIPLRSDINEMRQMILTNPDGEKVFDRAIDEHLCRCYQGDRNQRLVLEEIARAMSASLNLGGKILWCGNGGSAGESQHLAAETWTFSPGSSRSRVDLTTTGHFNSNCCGKRLWL